MVKGYFESKNILVLGASFGIGLELCKELAELKANLAIVARSKSKIESLAKELEGNHISISCDVTNPNELKNLATSLKQEWNSIDIVIYCAGTYEPMNLSNFDIEKSKSMVEINFVGLLYFIDSFNELFKQKKVKHLAIISSVAGYFGMPNSLAYGASKAALSHLTESLHYELKKVGTRVQLINPGFVDTRLTKKNKFSMPLIISSQKAAQIIIKKLPHNNFEIKFPYFFVFVMKLISLIPFKFRFAILSKLDK